MLRIIRILITLAALVSPAVFAPGVHITASLDKSDIRRGETHTLSVGVEGCVGTLTVNGGQGIVAQQRVIRTAKLVNVNIPIRVQQNARPGVRHITLRCQSGLTVVNADVVDAGYEVAIPIARR